jgi:hypothetical protein
VKKVTIRDMKKALKRGDIVKFLNHGFLQAGGAKYAE